MFGPPPKHPKKETFTDAVTIAAVAFAKAISPSTQENLSPQENQSPQHPVVLSPTNSVDLWNKNLQQLRFIQQFFEDNILTQEEYME